MITDDAVAGYLIHQQSLSNEKTGEFSLGIPIKGFWHSRSMPLLGFHLAFPTR